MKKVWILEKFVTPEDTLESIKQNEAMLESTTDPEMIEVVNEMIAKLRKIHEENPDGYWLGYQGKIVYRQFCECAHETMRNLKGAKFRVVKAEIEDNVWTWLGYKNPEVNEGVLKYLYATL